VRGSDPCEGVTVRGSDRARESHSPESEPTPAARRRRACRGDRLRDPGGAPRRSHTVWRLRRGRSHVVEAGRRAAALGRGQTPPAGHRSTDVVCPTDPVSGGEEAAEARADDSRPAKTPVRRRLPPGGDPRRAVGGEVHRGLRGRLLPGRAHRPRLTWPGPPASSTGRIRPWPGRRSTRAGGDASSSGPPWWDRGHRSAPPSPHPAARTTGSASPPTRDASRGFARPVAP
jgi:hypothetical protein